MLDRFDDIINDTSTKKPPSPKVVPNIGIKRASRLPIPKGKNSEKMVSVKDIAPLFSNEALIEAIRNKSLRSSSPFDYRISRIMFNGYMTEEEKEYVIEYLGRK